MYKEKIEELLRGTKRAGIEELIKQWRKTVSLLQPCSTRFHFWQKKEDSAEHQS